MYANKYDTFYFLLAEYEKSHPILVLGIECSVACSEPLNKGKSSLSRHFSLTKTIRIRLMDYDLERLVKQKYLYTFDIFTNRRKL